MTIWLTLQYLRGFAALAVVWLHSHVQLAKTSGLGPSTTTFGDFGVDLFFVLSGFIIWVTTDHERSRPLDFWRRRALRVVPLYWLCTFAMVALLVAVPTLFQESHLDFWHIVQSLLFIPHSDPLQPDVTFPLLQVGWTLNYEMFFYASFGVALLLRPTWRVTAMTAWLAVLVLSGALLSPKSALLATYTNPLLLEFMAGMLIGYACKRVAQTSLLFGYGLVFLAAATYVVLNHGLDITPMDWRALCWGLPAALLVAGVVVIERQTTIRRVAALLLLGDASFAIYLSHPFTLGAAGWVWGRFALETMLPDAAFIACALLICMLCGILLHLVFEKAFMGWLQKWSTEAAKQRRHLQGAEIPAGYS